VEWHIIALRKRAKIARDDACPVHTLIVLNLEQAARRLELIQSLEWPVLYMDSCAGGSILPLANGRKLRISLAELAFGEIGNLFTNGVLDLSQVIDIALENLKQFYNESGKTAVDGLSKLRPFRGLIEESLLGLFANNARLKLAGRFPQEVHNQLKAQATPPASLLNFLKTRLLKLIATSLSVLFHITVSGFSVDSDKDLFPNDISNARAILMRLAVQEMFAWAAAQTSPQVLQIETRFQCSRFGLYAGYQLLWSWALTATSGPDTFAAELQDDFFDGKHADPPLPLPKDFQAQMSDRESFYKVGLASFVLRLVPDLQITDSNAFDRFIELLGKCIDRWIDDVTFGKFTYILNEYELSAKIKSLAYLYQATPAELPPKMDLNRLKLGKFNQLQFLGPRYANAFFARLFGNGFHKMTGQMKFQHASDALQFFRGNFPAYMALHIGFSTRSTLDSDLIFDEDEPATEGGDGEDDGNAGHCYPGFFYDLSSRYLAAVEALICHPQVASVIEAGRADISVDRPFELEGGAEWEPAELYEHLGAICDACGVADPEVKEAALLDAVAVFITTDSKELIGYVDVDIPSEWPDKEEEKSPPVVEEEEEELE
jgi:hypothetical protein